MKKQLPYLLAWTRAALAMLVLILGLFNPSSAHLLIAWSIPLAVLTDNLDSALARAVGISSERLMHLKNQIELFYWLSLLIAFVMCVPKANEATWLWIGCSVLGEASLYIVSLCRFGKEPRTHTWMSKARSWVLAAALFHGFTHLEISCIPWALMFTYVAQMDVLCILLIIPKWEKNIPSSYHAAQMRWGIAVKRKMILNS
jgi:CDP-diacylglycerol--glycerol-3-phosphate 3-phosphatidyltransferase